MLLNDLLVELVKEAGIIVLMFALCWKLIEKVDGKNESD